VDADPLLIPGCHGPPIRALIRGLISRAFRVRLLTGERGDSDAVGVRFLPSRRTV